MTATETKAAEKKKFKPLRVTLAAKSEAAVLELVAQRYGIETDGVAVEAAGRERWTVSIPAQPARVRTRISSDGFEAWITEVTPVIGEGYDPPGAKELMRALRDDGIVFGIFDSALDRVAETVAREGRFTEQILVAEGKQPQSQGASEVRLRVPLEEFVEAGTEVVLLDVPLTAGRATTVRGETANTMVFTLDRKEVKFGEGLEPGPESKSFVVAKGGYVCRSEQQLFLRPLIKIAEDEITAALNVYPPGAGSRMIAHKDVLAALAREKVSYGIDEDAIRKALSRVEQSLIPAIEQVIARGKAPCEGVDAVLDFRVDLAEKVGVTKEDGSINFYERNLITNVKAGELLLEVQPARPGQPGITIRGEQKKAYEGKAQKVKASQGVTLEDEKFYRAAIDGVVRFKDGVLEVRDYFEIAGNVNFDTGNIDCSGTVCIKGTVQTGFTVRARGDIHINGSVEDALVDAGGEVVIRGGILMRGGEAGRPEAAKEAGGKRPAAPARRSAAKEAEAPAAKRPQGEVRAQGAVHLTFATNATVHAGGDILVKNEALNCHFVAGGRIVALEGKGIFIGGHLQAKDGIEARILGSDAHVRTDVVIDLPQAMTQELKDLTEQQTKVGEELEKINRAIASGLVEQMKQDPRKRESVLKVLQLLKDLKAQHARIAERQDYLQKLAEASKSGKIKVHGDAFPGVNIRIHDRQLKIDKAAHAYVFYLDRTEDKVARTPLLGS